jgi:caffeoyl-CoA O-methyltransferase
MMTAMTQGREAIEVGTLGGYSAICIARGLRQEGRLQTIELDETRASFAERQIARAGLSERVTVSRGKGLDLLEAMAGVRPAGSVDLVFLDAVKTEYPSYFAAVRSLIAPGGLMIADNILGTSQWWIDEVGRPAREAVDQLSRTLAADPEFEAVGLPLREGLLVARRRA